MAEEKNIEGLLVREVEKLGGYRFYYIYTRSRCLFTIERQDTQD